MSLAVVAALVVAGCDDVPRGADPEQYSPHGPVSPETTTYLPLSSAA